MSDVPTDFEVEQIAEHARKPVGYHIYDRHTQSKVGKSRTLRAANRKVDRKDNEYGAYRYNTRPVYLEEEY